MTIIQPKQYLYALVSFLCLDLCPRPCSAACNERTDTLELFNACQVISSTAARAPKPLSQTAENVTVITRKDIEALNAHTLTDVLDTVAGVQTQRNGGPGGLASTSIQSSSPFHLLVMVDGVSLDNINNDADSGAIPARIIERIEIIKGAASSSWGQALGGVINVITISPERNRSISGSADISIGERTTADSGANLSGTSGRLGYFLSGGRLGSNGLRPNSNIDSAYIYSKLDYTLPGRGRVTGTVHYSEADRGYLYVPQINMKNDFETGYLYTTLQLQHPLANRIELEVKGYYAKRDLDSAQKRISDSILFDVLHDREDSSGLSAQIIRHGDNSLLVAGAEYEHKEFRISDRLDPADRLRNHTTQFDRYGIFLNDTITLGPVSITPGARFDSTLHGDQFSPSLGITWQMTQKNLLRGYVAHGFSCPGRTNVWGIADIWTSQIGVESLAVPYIWLKGTLFRNDTGNVWDIYNQDRNIPEQRIALGSELEARTVPVLNTTLEAGWTYTDTHRDSDGSTVYGLPRHTVQLMLRYDDTTYRGALTGRHVWWHSNPAFEGSYSGLLWDLHLGAKLYKNEQNSLELFFSGHNLFNTAQYSDTFSPNTGRWFEGGMKVRF